MPYKLTVDVPNLADGGSLVIDGLGEFYSGDNEVTDDVVQNFERQHVRMEPAYVTDENGNPTDEEVGVTQVNVTVAELLKGMQGVTIEKVDANNVESTPEPAPTPVDEPNTNDNELDLQLDLGGNE